MARVFTIIEGLENLGALKTGGQGSVYKGRRMGEIITAIKLLPTPILAEDLNDKSYRDFINEVEKLKKVNEEPNPHVVTILGSGITETGGFPFIEMEFIEGSDLGELLKPPHDPVFTLQETIKVTTHISDALAHCHRCDVKHGDIKSNNIKYNKRTGNYMLLDFGLAIMSDEDRRTSLRHAGAIEFMAPEQNNGQVLFETDIYSFGVILFELLAGQVPFPLHDSGETDRNAVMVSHMETPPPDLLKLRAERLPASWSEEKKAVEMQVPEWLVSLVYKCLSKNPEERFSNGEELKEYVVLNSTVAVKKQEILAADSELIQAEVDRLLKEKDELQQLVIKYQKAAEASEEKIQNLRSIILQHEAEAPVNVSSASSVHSKRKTVAPALLYGLIGLVLVLTAVLLFNMISNNKVQNAALSDSSMLQTDTSANASYADVQNQKNTTAKLNEESQKRITTDTSKSLNNNTIAPEPGKQDTVAAENPMREQPQLKKENATTETSDDDNSSTTKYKVRSKAFFHNEPDASTKREAFIVHWNNAVLTPVREQNGFIYIVFTNHLGQTSRGWLKKSDLIPLND